MPSGITRKWRRRVRKAEASAKAKGGDLISFFKPSAWMPLREGSVPFSPPLTAAMIRDAVAKMKAANENPGITI